VTILCPLIFDPPHQKAVCFPPPNLLCVPTHTIPSVRNLFTHLFSLPIPFFFPFFFVCVLRSGMFFTLMFLLVSGTPQPFCRQPPFPLPFLPYHSPMKNPLFWPRWFPYPFCIYTCFTPPLPGVRPSLQSNRSCVSFSFLAGKKLFNRFVGAPPSTYATPSKLLFFHPFWGNSWVLICPPGTPLIWSCLLCFFPFAPSDDLSMSLLPLIGACSLVARTSPFARSDQSPPSFFLPLRPPSLSWPRAWGRQFRGPPAFQVHHRFV